MIIEAFIEDYLSTRREMPFEFGRNDCCLFGADYVLLVEGTDFAAEFRGKYTNEIGAARIIQENGGSLLALVERQMGRPPLPPLLAKVGDIVVCDLPAVGQTVGICTGPRGVFVARDGGFVTQELSRCLKAFKVEFPESN